MRCGRNGNEFRLGRARELKEILDDPLQAADFVANHDGVFVVAPGRPGKDFFRL